jgi:hypothetical protein
MELKSNEYQIECTPYGEYYAFLTDYHQCCTYGETAEEALETLSDIADEFFLSPAQKRTTADTAALFVKKSSCHFFCPNRRRRCSNRLTKSR